MRASLLQFSEISRTSVKKIFALALIISSTFSLYSQPGLIDSMSIPSPIHHFVPEYNFDRSSEPDRWKREKPGLNAAFGSTNRAYFRTEVPVLEENASSCELTGWKGEKLNGLLLAWSPDSISQVRFILNDLKAANGTVLSQKNLQLNLVKYVLSNYPYDAREVTCGVGPTDRAYLMPDRFEPINVSSIDRFDLPGRTVRSAWLSINLPANIPAGTYTGNIEVRSQHDTRLLNLKIKVQDQTLPRPYDWTFRLDLWQNPWVVAWYYEVKPWSAEHKALLKKHLKLYADAGGKYITTYAVHSPWADNSYMVEGTMIEWIKRKNGSWKFDYSIFDQYVQLCMEAGIDKAITIYTPIPWGERFRYLEEATSNYTYERWLPTSDTFKTNWNYFLTDLKAHLEKKGWFNKTYLGINENAMEQTLGAIKVLKSHSKKWRITYAGDWHPQLDSLLDDYSCVYGKEPGMGDLRRRTKKGQSSTYYICCTPPKPNTFVFSPPVEGRWLGWYAYAYGYDGLLRWAYDAWPKDPVRDARHTLWGAGDCFMIYPGGASSIRFEKMREGISDFEKIKILIAKTANSTDPMIREKREELQIHLQVFTAEREFESEKLEDDLEKGQQLIEELSERLSIISKAKK